MNLPSYKKRCCVCQKLLGGEQQTYRTLGLYVNCDVIQLGFVPGCAINALPCESEIQQLYHTARSRKDVRWFEVAMSDLFRVRGFERCSDFRGEPQGLKAWGCSRETIGAPSTYSMTR